MDENQAPHVVADDVVVSLEYKLVVGGEIVDEAGKGDPLEYLHGHNNILSGLEQELYGMAMGEKKAITIAAHDAYGEIDPTAYVDVPREEFPPDIPLEPGIPLQVRDDQGEEMDASIEKVDKNSVTLNFNHPLAGVDLHFEVIIAGLRQATEQELEHGQVHSPHMHEDEDEYEFDDLEGEDFEDEDFDDDDLVDENFEDDEYDQEDDK